MKLASKASLKPFTLLIFVHFLLSRFSESHILLVIVSTQGDFKARNYSRSLEPWNMWIVALLMRVLNLQTRRGARAYIMSNAPPCWACMGWRRCRLALQDVRSFHWLLP